MVCLFELHLRLMDLNVLNYQSCNVTALPVVTKDLPISSRFLAYGFLSQCKLNTVTPRRFPLLRESEKYPDFVKTGTHDPRTTHHSGDDKMLNTDV